MWLNSVSEYNWNRFEHIVFQVHMCKAKVSARSCVFYNNVEGNFRLLDFTVYNVQDGDPFPVRLFIPYHFVNPAKREWKVVLVK